MSIVSISFLTFFLVILAAFYVLPKVARPYWLLLGSYYFYMMNGPEYVLWLIVATLVTWITGLLIARFEEKPRIQKLCMALSIVICLGMLLVVKYLPFMQQMLTALSLALGYEMPQHTFTILAPLGISYFTFQSIGYLVDVYRKDVEAEKSILYYALFVSFFPQITAGPISRASSLIPQIRELTKLRYWDQGYFVRGLTLVIWGFFLKMVLADRLAILVNTVYETYWMYDTFEILTAVFAYSWQIYCDFMGYTSIAIGFGLLVGLELKDNFAAPYLATSVQDFWRRWHISLSSWFRDYLYIPMGGGKKGFLRKQCNILLVFLLSGIWHGASWNFLLWGALHGTFQVLENCAKPVGNYLVRVFHVRNQTIGFRLGRMLMTNVIVAFAWIFFRMENLEEVTSLLERMIHSFDPWFFFDGSILTLGLARVEINILLMGGVIVLLADLVKEVRGTRMDIFLQTQTIFFRWFVLLVLLLMIFVFGIYGPAFDSQTFLYNQF